MKKVQSKCIVLAGYTGCTIDHNYNDFAMASYDFKSGSEWVARSIANQTKNTLKYSVLRNTKAWINFGDVSISQGHELTVKVTGQNDLKWVFERSGVQEFPAFRMHPRLHDRLAIIAKWGVMEHDWNFKDEKLTPTILGSAAALRKTTLTSPITLTWTYRGIRRPRTTSSLHRSTSLAVCVFDKLTVI